ncbi:UNVERIFIED_CONTAM: spore photoproduct lyase [Acetivibrio alkalicellulosi]
MNTLDKSSNKIDYKGEGFKTKNLFNVIYVEEAAFKYPITKEVLDKYCNLQVITIRHYKDVFNRTNQHFQIQKQYQSLILAVKDKPFLYEGPQVCQNFGYPNFYYTSFLLNCIFDCGYCYLQGMYNSANIVAFVNVEDFKNSIEQESLKKPVFLAVSYDTDLIGFYNIIPYIDYFYGFFKMHPALTVEIRTKSGNQSFYKTHTALDNIVIAFTLSPQEIIEKYEKNTPPLKTRIKAIKTALDQGFKVRICLDPVFINPVADHLYEPFYEYVFSEINANKILDLSFGFFRMSKEFFKRIKKQSEYSDLFLDEYCLNENVISYPKEYQNNIMTRHYQILTNYMKKEKIFSL